MNVSQLGRGDVLPLPFQIRDLAGNELFGAGCFRQFKYDVPVPIASPTLAPAGQRKCFCQQSVPSQNGDPFAEDFVIRRLAPAQIVVIHRWQVIVDLGIRVDAFHRARQRHGVLDLSPARFRCRQTQCRAHPFSPCEKGIPHGLVDRCRFGGGGRQKVVQGAIHRGRLFRQIPLQVEGLG